MPQGGKIGGIGKITFEENGKSICTDVCKISFLPSCLKTFEEIIILPFNPRVPAVACVTRHCKQWSMCVCQSSLSVHMLIRFVTTETHIHMHTGICVFWFSKFDRHHKLQVLIEPVKWYGTQFTSFLAPRVSCSYSEEVILQKYWHLHCLQLSIHQKTGILSFPILLQESRNWMLFQYFLYS